MNDLYLTTRPKPAERRKERLRTRIIEEATKLYHKNGGEEGGFENTTLESIAEKSDISLRTFFRYFESKQDVIYLDCRRSVDDLEQHIRAFIGRFSPVDAVIRGSISQLEAFVASPVNRDRLARSLRSQNFEDRRAVWNGMTRRRLKDLLIPLYSDRPHPEVAAGMVAVVVRGAIEEALDKWVSTPNSDPLPLVGAALNEVRSLFAQYTLPGED